MKYNELLFDKLLRLGGTTFFRDQLIFDPDCEFIYNQGKIFNESKILFLMQPNRCSWNISKLFSEGNLDSIVIGYALHDKCWFQHTWGLKDHKIIETTIIGDLYFGAILDVPNSFVDLCNVNPPGKGKVRRNSC